MIAITQVDMHVLPFTYKLLQYIYFLSVKINKMKFAEMRLYIKRIERGYQEQVSWLVFRNMYPCTRKGIDVNVKEFRSLLS